MPRGGIRQAITRAIADQARTIRIPVHMIETINKLIRTSRQLVRNSAANRPRKNCQAHGHSVAKVRKILKNRAGADFPGDAIGEEEDSHLGDFIEDKAVVSPSDAVINLNLKEQTSSVLKTLTRARKKSSRCVSAWTTAPNTRSRKSASRSPSRASASGKSNQGAAQACATRRARASSAPSSKALRAITSDSRLG